LKIRNRDENIQMDKNKILLRKYKGSSMFRFLKKSPLSFSKVVLLAYIPTSSV
jgi:hypothetical protein